MNTTFANISKPEVALCKPSIRIYGNLTSKKSSNYVHYSGQEKRILKAKTTFESRKSQLSKIQAAKPYFCKNRPVLNHYR